MKAAGKRVRRTALVIMAAAAIVGFIALRGKDSTFAAEGKAGSETKPSAAAAAQTPDPQPSAKQGTPAGKPSELPDENGLQLAAESSRLQLWVDAKSAHFKVVNKASGKVWRSYPNPAQWANEKLTGSWRANLLSPVFVETIDMSSTKSQTKIRNWREDNGVLEGFEPIQGGYRATFSFTASGIKIPVEVKLQDDYVETKVLEAGVQEGKQSLLNVKLFPMFGAEPSLGQEGYLFIPDGSGALIRFKQSPAADNLFYRENVYGADESFYNEDTARQTVKMPVYGMKSGDQGFLAVMTSGEAYAKLYAVPAGIYGHFNWVTAEWQFRSKFFQNTSRRGPAGFFTYNKERFPVPERTTRYYPLEGEQTDYAGMAAAYRSYLIQEKGLKPLQPDNRGLPFFADLIGADSKKGLLRDTYLAGTTTAEAEGIVNRLYKAGVSNIVVQYAGWQKGGYSRFGGLFPVDARLGGNEGMKAFIASAHAKSVPVYLTADYSLNNTGGDGFLERFNGLRNLAGSIVKTHNPASGEDIPKTSPRFASKTLRSDLELYRSLGADGISLRGGLGRWPNTDFNGKYRATRVEVQELQADDLRAVKETLGGVIAEDAGFYALGAVSHIHHLANDYSYDIFVDEAVPFAQIVLHGLVTYTSGWSNLRNEYQSDFLRSIEYGEAPGYVLTSAPSGRMKGAYSVWYYSMNAGDWEQSAVEEYKRANEALGDVQNRFITAHRTLAPKVKETVYEGGKSIIVNYNAEDYVSGDIRVPALGYLVRTGGKGQ